MIVKVKNDSIIKSNMEQEKKVKYFFFKEYMTNILICTFKMNVFGSLGNDFKVLDHLESSDMSVHLYINSNLFRMPNYKKYCLVLGQSLQYALNLYLSL